MIDRDKHGNLPRKIYRCQATDWWPGIVALWCGTFGVEYFDSLGKTECKVCGGQTAETYGPVAPLYMIHYDMIGELSLAWKKIAQAWWIRTTPIGPRGRLKSRPQARDIADDAVLDAINKAITASPWNRDTPEIYRSASRWDLERYLPHVPGKLILAKLRSMHRRKLIDANCLCGCRGDISRFGRGYGAIDGGYGRMRK